MKKTESYRPSNGSEGMDFYAAWCARCTKEVRYQRTEENPCHIQINTMAYEFGSPAYPKEWVKDVGEYPGNPRCTAFRESRAHHIRGDVKQLPPDKLPLFRRVP